MPDVAVMKITVHSKTDCPYCAVVKEWLAKKGLPYVEQKHETQEEREALYDRLGLVNVPGQPPERTVPQVILEVDGEEHRIGGSKALELSGLESLFRT